MSDPVQLTELITVRDFLRFAVSRFNSASLSYGHGTATALDEAAFLILETLHLPIGDLEPWLDARLTRAERTALANLIEKRVVTRKPASYITGSAYLGPYRFVVDERVIVPRSFIAELLLDDALPIDGEVRSVLDLCTGSGCLAIVAAHMFPDATITAVDISSDALAVAAENVGKHRLGHRVALAQGDLFAGIADARYDLIICNPPYVTTDVVANFPPEYRSEPVLAHLGGVDGMDLVRRVLDRAGRHLSDAGHLVMEVGSGRTTLQRDFPRLPFLWLDTETSEGEVLLLPGAALQPVAVDKRQRIKQTVRSSKTSR